MTHCGHKCKLVIAPHNNPLNPFWITYLAGLDWVRNIRKEIWNPPSWRNQTASTPLAIWRCGIIKVQVQKYTLPQPKRGHLLVMTALPTSARVCVGWSLLAEWNGRVWSFLPTAIWGFHFFFYLFLILAWHVQCKLFCADWDIFMDDKISVT